MIMLGWNFQHKKYWSSENNFMNTQIPPLTKLQLGS